MSVTRTGRIYNLGESANETEQDVESDQAVITMAETGTGVTELLQMLLEDRRSRDEAETERARAREEENRQRERERAEEQERRERESEQRMQMMQSQVEMMRNWMDLNQSREEIKAKRADNLRHLNLAKLTEKDDIEAYLTTFERLMTAFEVKEEHWAHKLAPQLTGRAQQAFAAMDVEKTKNYEDVKRAILQRYDISEETYRKRFRTTKKAEGEAYLELATKLRDLLEKWTAGCTTMEALKEKIVVEQLMEGMPRDLRIWLGDRKPTTGEEAGRLADSYVHSRQLDPKELPPRETRRPSRESGATKTCHYCKIKGHIAKDCRKAMADRMTEKGRREANKTKMEWNKIKCYNCQETGHIAANCPSKSNLFTEETELVYMNEDKLEKKINPQITRSGTVEGKAVDEIVLDTGCARSMVRSDLLPQKKQLGRVRIRCAHGDVREYPLVSVEIGLGEGRHQIEAAISKTLPVPVLLGRDVAGLLEMLQNKEGTVRTEEALAVMTRAQAKKNEEERVELEKIQQQEGIKQPTTTSDTSTDEMPDDQVAKMVPNTTNTPDDQQAEMLTDLDVTDDQIAEMPIGAEMDPDLFLEVKKHQQLTRREKRQQRREVAQNKQTHPLDLSPIELRRMQQEDVTLKGIREAMNGATGASKMVFHEENGLIYRQWISPHGEDSSPIQQLVLPESCRSLVMSLAHHIPMAGHMGQRKTVERILQRFYWPTVFEDVKKLCQSCEECQRTSKGKKQRVPMIPLPIIREPFERIAMDIVGPLPRSRTGNRYILVICDYSTRYPEAVPLRTIDAEHVAKELIMFFSRVGIPREILTDQGANFTSGLLAELYRLLKIQPIKTSPYHPQTDGLVERFNQTLKSMLRKTANQEGKDWDQLIPYLLFAYREVPQSSTGFSPFELMYGRQVRGPLDVLKETWESSKKSTESVVSYVLTIQEKLAKMSELACENLKKAQTTQKKWYDRNARERKLQVEDNVLVLLPSSTNKLLAKWQGPYPVKKVISPVTYEVDMFDHKKRRRVFHINMLRKWNTPTIPNLLAEEERGELTDELPLWKESDSITKKIVMDKRLEETQQYDLRQLTNEFVEAMRDTPGRTAIIEHDIETGTARPIRLPPYRLPHAYRETVKKEIAEMLEHGVIEPSTSEWSAPIVLVKKKDGTMRFCVDYRRLNGVSEADAYPMPRIDEMIDRLGQAKYITTLDLTKGYWQVPLTKKAQTKTAFVTPFGLYHFNVMPFGLQGAPATFQRLMDRVLQGLEEYAAAYLDDVVIYSSNWKDHLYHLRQVLERIQDAGLTMKLSKCQFGMAHCIYLGHVVGSGVVKPEETKLEAMREFPRPKTKKEARCFLGLTGYYRRFIPDFASIAAPLSDLTRKNLPSTVIWTPACETAFQTLKKQMLSQPILHNPDFSRAFVLQTDASQRGVGAVLSQTDGDGAEHPVGYFSRKLLNREEHYSTVEKECLAIKLAVEAFRVYLLGRPFVIQTDHHSLEWMERMKENNNRLIRWSLALQPFNFSVRYRKGKDNQNADALSRLPISHPDMNVAGEGERNVVN